MSKSFNPGQMLDALHRQGYSGYGIDYAAPGFLLTLQRHDGTEDRRRMSSGELEAWIDGMLSGGPPLEGTGPLPLERRGG